MLKDPRVIILALGKKVNKTPTCTMDMVDLDVHNDKSVKDNELDSPMGSKVNVSSLKWRLQNSVAR